VPDTLSPSERTLRARAAAHARWAVHDPKEHGGIMRKGFHARFTREVLEHAAARGEELTAEEIGRRAESLFRSHMARLALLSARARRKGAKDGP
jgi:hypothetical protein